MNSALLNYNVISADNVSVVNWVIGIVIMFLVAAILLGGIKRIAKVTEKHAQLEYFREFFKAMVCGENFEESKFDCEFLLDINQSVSNDGVLTRN